MDDALHRPPAAGMPRIAVVSHTHPSISKGGAEIAAYTLFSGLRRLGVEALFIAGCAEKDRPRLHFETPHERAVFHEPERYDHLYHAGSPLLGRDLARLLQAERIGLTNFHHYLFLGLGALHAAKRLPGMQVALTLHEYLGICQNHGQMVTRPGRALCEAAHPVPCQECFPELQYTQLKLRREHFLDAFAQVDWFVSPSRFLAERYAAWGIERQRIGVIENGLRGFAAQHPGGAPRALEAPWVFGYFGQINPFKGVDVLLRACEAIARDADLAGRLQIRVHGNMVGQPAAFVEKFEAATAEYAFFSYAGAYTNNTVHRLMDACDYVLVPSTWWENSPVVIQEAYAARRPVLCSGIGGMAEKVPHGVAGLHFRPGDPLSLVQALRQAMSDSLHASLQQALPQPIDECEMARRYLEHFGLAGDLSEHALSRPSEPEHRAARTPRPAKVRRPGRTEVPQRSMTSSLEDADAPVQAAEPAALSSAG